MYVYFQCSFVEDQNVLNSFDKDKLKHYREHLISCVNPDDLVKQLQESNITLSSVQKKKMTLKNTTKKQVMYLLDVLAVLPENAFQALVDLLIKTNQPTLVELLKDHSDLITGIIILHFINYN